MRLSSRILRSGAGRVSSIGLFWKKASQAGLLGATVPPDYGGAGGDRVFDVIIAYEQARAGDSGWGWGVHNACTHCILAFGTEEQKTRWLPGLVSGVDAIRKRSA